MEVDVLRDIGFLKVADWSLEYDEEKGDQLFIEAHGFDASRVLYAFVADTKILYIGKTRNRFMKRMKQYIKAHKSQSTNTQIQGKLINRMGNVGPVNIYALTNKVPIQYGSFHVDIAAGLEDDLIKQIRPPWNKL